MRKKNLTQKVLVVGFFLFNFVFVSFFEKDCLADGFPSCLDPLSESCPLKDQYIQGYPPPPPPPKKNQTQKIITQDDYQSAQNKQKQKEQEKKKSEQVKKIVQSSVANQIASLPIEVHPEKTVWIELSNTDVNRVVCIEGKITNVFYSQEKGVIVKISEDEVYIKFKTLFNPQTNKTVRITTPTEFYIRCAGKTYSFIAQPKSIPTKTVYLVDVTKRMEPPKDLLEKASVDEAIVKIVRQVFLDRIPPYWEKPEKFLPVLVNKTFVDQKTNEQATIRIMEMNRYRIPGTPILVRVFKIKLLDFGKYVHLNEKVLLDAKLTKNPIAISVLDHWLMTGKKETRGVIIEKLFP